MKKLVAILLLLFYLPAIIGVAISADLCCGKIASVKIKPAEKKCRHHFESEDCCDDITHFFKIHDPQQIAVSDISFKTPVFLIPALLSAANLTAFATVENNAVNARFFHQPPLRAELPLFIRHESFLI